jgi:hypothetical protein
VGEGGGSGVRRVGEGGGMVGGGGRGWRWWFKKGGGGGGVRWAKVEERGSPRFVGNVEVGVWEMLR